MILCKYCSAQCGLLKSLHSKWNLKLPLLVETAKMLTGFWRSQPHTFLNNMLDIQVFKSHHWWYYYKSYCKLTTLSPLTYIMEESEKDVILDSITHLLPQLSKILLTVRNPQLQIALNPLISIQYIHCAGLFYILNKQSNTNCRNTQRMNGYMENSHVWLTAWYFFRHIPTVILPVTAPGSRYTSPILAGELVGLTGLSWEGLEKQLPSIRLA